MLKEHYYKGTYCGIEDVMPNVEGVLKEHDPQIIVEIGTYRGGFTKYLCDWFPEASIYSFDIMDLVSTNDQEYFFIRGNVTRIITMEIFRSGSLIRLILSSTKRKLLFCDGGEKTDEIRLYAGMLMPGDMLGCHDWDSEIVKWEVEGVLSEFEPCTINKTFENGKSELRFFIRKSIEGKEKLPNNYKTIKL